VPEALRAYLRPREGWLALGLLLVMVLSLGWSVQRAGWIERLDYIVPLAFYAVLLGMVLALSRLSVAIVVPVSAVVGAALILWIVGGEYIPEQTQLDRLFALRAEAINWTRIVLDEGYGPQLTPYAIGLGVVMWVTSFIAAYTLYRHHRVMDAIFLVGAALIANMAPSLRDLFIYLVLFVLAALLLWLRTALIGREEGWQRRRVNENAEVPGAILRSGIAFIAGTILLAWVLTSVAVAAPLTTVWNNLDGVWSEVRDNLDNIFGGLGRGGQSRIGGSDFLSSMSISGSWVSADDPVLTVASQRPYYLRTITFDVYTGHGWDQSSPRQDRAVPADSPIFPDDSPEWPTKLDAFVAETVTIQVDSSVGRNAFSPGFPLLAKAPLVVVGSGGQSNLAELRADSAVSPGEGYQITALISNATEAQLQAAGQNYPQAIRDFYLGTPGVTERTALLAHQIVDEAGAKTPYDMAKALADYLQGPGFRYSVNAKLPSDPDRDIVDFFLFDPDGKVGYCEYYATTMAIMARTLGIPARVATGFAPGERIGDAEGEGNRYLVRRENAHAWAEIYFPGYGWQSVEATKTIPPITRPRGVTAPTGGSGPLPSGGPSEDWRKLIEDAPISTLPSFQPIPGTTGGEGETDETRGGNTLIFVAIFAVALGIGAWRLLRSRRRMRFLAPGERQWYRLLLAADRAGVAQRPSETIYEYAGWLEEQIPGRRPEIRTIASGKVWQSYSGRGISGEAIARIEQAWRRLQLPLVWLAIKRRVRSLLPGR
jgi:transglutaminase-like putative cysteine protease